MKRRNFLKGILGGVVVGPTILTKANAIKKLKVKKPKVKEPVVYLGLLCNGEEVATKDYRRLKIKGMHWEFNSANQLCNTKAIVFPEAKNNWGKITEFAFYDKDGNMLLWGEVLKAASVMEGEMASFSAYDIVMKL